MPDASSSSPSDPLVPSDPSNTAGDAPPDELIPESEATTAAEEDTFFDDDSSAENAPNDPLVPSDPSNTANDASPDELIPESEATTAAEEDIFFDEASSAENAPAEMRDSPAPESGGEPTDASSPQEVSSDSGQEADLEATEADSSSGDPDRGTEPNSTLPGSASNTAAVADDPMMRSAGEAIFAAGEALIEAGEALRSAELGGTIPGENNDVAAQSKLSEAQIAVILARASIDEALSESTQNSNSEQALLQASERLDQAAEAIARATLGTEIGDGDALEEPRGGADEALTVLGREGSDQRIAELDAELNASIAVFESDMQSAREAASAALSGKTLTAVAGPEAAGDFERGIEASAGVAGDDEEDAAATASPGLGQEASGDDSDSQSVVTGRTPDGRRFESPPPPEDLEIPEDIPSPQGDDIVAKQLREAAMAEQDPELREKLWEEYKRYKAGL